MFLFLDVISPIPEFSIIEDNKVIFQRKILKNESDKLSDYIFETYIEISKKLNLSNKLNEIAMTVGPGSYTSLRVGAAFISGLKIQKNIKFCPISINDIFTFKANLNNTINFNVFIKSSKNQYFICRMDHKKQIEYIKLEKNDFILNTEIKTIYYNSVKLNSNTQDLIQKKFFFIDEILQNKNKLRFSKNLIIKPIYISNNNILN